MKLVECIKLHTFCSNNNVFCKNGKLEIFKIYFVTQFTYFCVQYHCYYLYEFDFKFYKLLVGSFLWSVGLESAEEASEYELSLIEVSATSFLDCVLVA